MREYWSVLSIWQFYSWTFCHENESLSVKFTSLIVGVFEKISKKYTFPRFLSFNLLPKNFISSDSQWMAKLVFGSANLKSAQNFRPEKRFRRRWVVNCGRCVVSWLLCSSLDIKKSGYKPWLGTLLCSGTQHLTLTVPLSLPRCINRLT